MTAKILQFPEDRIVRKFPELQESLKKESEAKGVDDFSEGLINHIYEFLSINGVSSDEFETKDFPMIAGSIKAAVYRKFGMPHMMHPMIDEAFDEAVKELTESGNTN